MHAQRNALELSLRAEIAARGPIPFVEYMTRCLSEYYSHLSEIGQAGDFVTAPELGPYFADALAHAIAPRLVDYSVIVELGAGTGQLAFDLLKNLAQLNALPEAYFIQETSPSLREVQAQKLRSLPQEISQIVSWQKPDQIKGILIANEVFDALPVERFIQTESGKKRLGIDWQNDQFVEVILDEVLDFNPFGVDTDPMLGQDLLPAQTVLTALRNSRSANPAQALDQYDFEIGYRSEYCPGLGAFLDTILPVFESGLAFVIDYGYERGDYYAPYRRNGTLQAYFQHREVSPFEKPGDVDLTAHVDFTTLAELMMARGWQIDFLKPQNQFLLEQNLLERFPLTAEHYALKRLLDPRLMGEVFRVMGAHLSF